MTVRESISKIRQGLNSVRLDNRISNRFIYYTLQEHAENIIKNSDKKKILNNLTTLTKFDCSSLEDVELKSCYPVLVNDCRNLKRSVMKFSDPYLSGLLLPLLYLSSVDDSEMYIPTTPYGYSRIIKRDIRGPEVYYWFEEGYIYFPDTELESIKVRGYFKSSVSNKQNGVCKNFLDTEFNIPSYLSAAIFNEATKYIATYAKRALVDEDSNLNLNDKQ